MKRNWPAILSMALVCIFVTLSFGMGAKQYNRTRETIIANLNAALREAVKMHANNWLCRDTIQSYAKLQQQMGAAVTLHTYDNIFAEALPEKRFKENAGIQISVMNMSSHQQGEALAENADNGYIMSDTIMLMNNAKVADAALSLRGYVFCPFINIISMTNLTTPTILLALAFCFGGLYFYFRRKYSVKNEKETSGADNSKIITFGDLSLSTEDSCVYDLNSKRLNLTPMEYSLMEMFYCSSSHFLLKKDICDTLWPGKDNADETLYALIRRLKQTLAEHSNLKISAIRGRAYQLDLDQIV
jgi:DNA-binding winged helix-turn-helix (wHTH) protein